MTRYNFAGQRLTDDAPELPGDFEVEDEKACDVYRDVQAPDLHFYLLHENGHGTYFTLEVGEFHASGRGDVMRWTEEEFTLCFEKVVHLPAELLISFEGFGFNPRTYRQQEVELLQPQLEALGYTGIKFEDGERDSFGPLTRVICTDQGKLIYG